MARAMALGRCGIIGFIVLCLLASDSRGARAVREHDLKAAFLLNFARFAEWPSSTFPDPSTPIVVGILGDNPFGDGLQQTFAQQTAQGRPIRVVFLSEDDDYRSCHLLFISRSLAPRYEKILSRLERSPVLTVGETEPFVRKGGVIGFALVNDNVRFDVNARAAENAGLKFSSKLLAVARAVLRSP